MKSNLERIPVINRTRTDIEWLVSRTCEGGACVGVARRGEYVLIGNTSNHEGPVGEFTIDEWQQFLAGVKLGDFDRIA
jgi:predicted secreted Zn-dependent protease